MVLHVVHFMIFSPFLTNKIIVVKIKSSEEKFQVQFALGRGKKKKDKNPIQVRHELFHNIIKGSPVNDSILFLGFAGNTFKNNSNVVASLWQLSIDAGTQHKQWLSSTILSGEKKKTLIYNVTWFKKCDMFQRRKLPSTLQILLQQFDLYYR